MSNSQIVQRCITTGDSARICIPGKIDFTIASRNIPAPLEDPPIKPLLWKECKGLMRKEAWRATRDHYNKLYDQWLHAKAYNQAEKKAVKKLERIKTMVSRFEP